MSFFFARALRHPPLAASLSSLAPAVSKRALSVMPERTVPDEVIRWEERAYFSAGRTSPRIPVQHLKGEYKVNVRCPHCQMLECSALLIRWPCPGKAAGESPRPQPDPGRGAAPRRARRTALQNNHQGPDPHGGEVSKPPRKQKVRSVACLDKRILSSELPLTST